MDDADRTEARREAEEEMKRLNKEALKTLPVVRHEACQECDEPITPLRQDLGAIRCIDCQQDFDGTGPRRRLLTCLERVL